MRPSLSSGFRPPSGLDLPRHTDPQPLFYSTLDLTNNLRPAASLCVANSHDISGPFEPRLAWNDKGGASKVAPPKG